MGNFRALEDWDDDMDDFTMEKLVATHADHGVEYRWDAVPVHLGEMMRKRQPFHSTIPSVLLRETNWKCSKKLLKKMRI